MLESVISKLILTIIGSSLLALSSPGYDYSFFAWFALSSLFFVINLSSRKTTAILYSFLFGFIYNLLALKWIFTLHPLTWIGLNNLQSLLVASASLIVVSIHGGMFFALFGFIYKLILETTKSKCKDIISSSIISLIWLIIFNKLLASQILLGFPWTLIEYSQHNNKFLIQISDLLGSQFISFLIVYFNLVLSDTFISVFSVEKIGNRRIAKNPGEPELIIANFLFISSLIIVSIIYGCYKVNNYEIPYNKKSKLISIIQGNLPISATRGKVLDLNLSQGIYTRLINTCRSNLIITPEGSIPTAINNADNVLSWIRRNGKKLNSDIIAGSYCKNESMITNCALIYNKNLDIFTYYDKSHLVPFGEFIPMYSLLPSPLKDLADQLIGSGFDAGKETTPKNVSFSKTGISICFELIFPNLIRQLASKDSGFLINLSDLSWFSSDLVKKQFIAIGKFRAIENRKVLIIATNSGVSTIITPNGKIKTKSASNKQTVINSWINTSNENTFYTKYGW